LISWAIVPSKRSGVDPPGKSGGLHIGFPVAGRACLGLAALYINPQKSLDIYGIAN
jgi:hypothetical protein